MFISKREFMKLKKKVADLEVQVQSQQKVIDYLGIDPSENPLEHITNFISRALQTEQDQ